MLTLVAIETMPMNMNLSQCYGSCDLTSWIWHSGLACQMVPLCFEIWLRVVRLMQLTQHRSVIAVTAAMEDCMLSAVVAVEFDTVEISLYMVDECDEVDACYLMVMLMVDILLTVCRMKKKTEKSLEPSLLVLAY